MKKLLYILFTITCFVACSSDDEPVEPKQDYTSFMFEQTVDNDLPNCIAAYKKNNKYYKLGNLGNLSKGKQSPEIRINDNSITEVYFFTDYNGVVRFDYTYTLKKNNKNIFKLTTGVGGIKITDKADPSQYPQ